MLGDLPPFPPDPDLPEIIIIKKYTSFLLVIHSLKAGDSD